MSRGDGVGIAFSCPPCELTVPAHLRSDCGGIAAVAAEVIFSWRGAGCMEAVGDPRRAGVAKVGRMPPCAPPGSRRAAGGRRVPSLATAQVSTRVPAGATHPAETLPPVRQVAQRPHRNHPPRRVPPSDSRRVQSNGRSRTGLRSHYCVLGGMIEFPTTAGRKQHDDLWDQRRLATRNSLLTPRDPQLATHSSRPATHYSRPATRYSRIVAPNRSAATAAPASFASVASFAVRVRSLARNRSAKVSDLAPSGMPGPR